MTTTTPSRLPALTGLALAAALALGSTSASAQNTDTIDISANHGFSSVDGDESLVVNIRNCRDSVGAEWDFTVTFDSASYTNTDGSRSDYSLKLEKASGACTSELSQSADNCELFQGVEQIPSTFQITRTVAFNALTDLASTDDCLGRSGTVSFVVVSELIEADATSVNNGSKDPSPISDRFSLTFKTTRPEPPTGLTATAGESNVRVAFTAPSGAPSDATYNVYIASDVDLSAGAAPEPIEEAGVRRVVGSASTAVVVDSGLAVDTTYQVAVVTVDADGNESLLSEVVTVTTSPTADFYETYRNAGGADTGGFCSTASPTAPVSGSALWLCLGALVVGGLLRRRLAGVATRGAVVGAAVVAVLAIPSVASAQFDRLESKPGGTFELRLGTYLPEVDANLGDPGPYEQVFDNESMLLLELEFDRVLWDDFGMAGVGFNFGFMQAVGKALDASGNSSVDTTVFNIMPFRLAGIYRFDFLAQTLGIPFVFVGKAGLDYYLWWITTGSGAIARSDDGEGFGGTFGYHVAFAVHLYLDFFNQRSANNLRFDFGILNTYFFGEYMLSVVDDFGDSSSLNLSDGNLMFGLAFDY